jgi:hypothetical protein
MSGGQYASQPQVPLLPFFPHPGGYPNGQGAGFAGGSTAAAVDGIRGAEGIAQRAGAPAFPPFQRRKKAGEYATE